MMRLVRPDADADTVREKFAQARKAMSSALIERDDEIDLVLTGGRVASLYAHDPRLALMLFRASLQNPALRNIPIVDFDGVWTCLMGLYPNEIRDAATHRRNYEALAVAIDVGVEGEFREELQSLASYFDRQESELLVCSNVSVSCGLGLAPPAMM